MGFDFHLGDDGPRLIEVNTNAGGAFINAHLARAQRACCGSAVPTPDTIATFEDAVMRLFEREWQRQRGGGRPARVAIVDDDPEAQYLYPEFRLAQRLLQDRGVATRILDPTKLRYADGTLSHDGWPIDLVYNRLVDFGLDEPCHAALRAAYRDRAVVLTPNPHNHALLADKRNLIPLSDSRRLRAWGLSEEDAAVLEQAVPHTVPVTPENAQALWEDRRRWFFKPAAGHGSKGVYRGSKLPRGVFAELAQGDYIAQTYTPPSERRLRADDATVDLKLDARLYTYDAELLLVAARVYQGQATNLRTPGGGFAPVFTV